MSQKVGEIALAFARYAESCAPTSERGPFIWKHRVALARLGIEALREPTDAMLAAAKPALADVEGLIAVASARGAVLRWTDDKSPLWHAWQAMIDEALNETPPTKGQTS